MINLQKEYIENLKERNELDWLFSQLIEVQGWQGLKVPFQFKEDSKELSGKGEAEFGIDLSCFKDASRKKLVIFAIKAEKLTAKNWGDKNFAGDLQQACSTDLSKEEYENVEEMEVILAFNKDLSL